VSLIIEAARTSPPAWQNAAFVGTILCFAVAGIPAFKKVELSTARKLYWSGCIGAALLGAVTVSRRGWAACLAVVFLISFLSLLRAYFQTPYLKIGRRVIAHSISDTLAEESDQSRSDSQDPPADSYSGLATAPKQWWVFAALACILGGAVYSLGWDWRGIFAVAFLTFLGAATGHDDSSRNLTMARGQKVQALIVLVASIPMFLVPPAAYLAGYQIGKRHPHNRSRHSR
jgi:hypothetical protein